MIRCELPIVGMHCAGCAKIIEDSIRLVPEVKDVSVNFATERARISIPPDGKLLAPVVEQVKRAGYHVALRRATYRISGNDDPTPALSAERAIGSRVGVISATINVHAGNARVEYVDTIVAEDEVKALFATFGFSVAATEGASDEAVAIHRRLAWKLAASIFLTAILMTLSMQEMATGRQFLDGETTSWLLLLITLPIHFWCGRQFHAGLLNSIRRRTADMNTLISLGTNGALAASLMAMFAPSRFGGHGGGHAPVYFETVGMIVTFVLLGKWLESRVKGKTNAVVRLLADLRPEEATVERGGVETIIPVNLLAVGDVILVKPGRRIPADGTVREGAAAVDESMMTGEPLPVDKRAGSKVSCGTINRSGAFIFVAERVGGDTLLSQIIRQVEEAQATKPSIQRLADAIAGIFVPIVITIALVTFSAWLALGGYDRLADAIRHSIAVLLVSCPCALGLATPTAIVAAIGNAARSGILIKEAEAMEQSTAIDTVIFDKTGTLTAGRPTVVEIVPAANASADALLERAAVVEKRSEHPIAKAICERHGGATESPLSFESLTSLGAKGVLKNGDTVLVGNRQAMEYNGVDLSPAETEIERLSRDGATCVFVARNGKWEGTIAVADTVRDGAKDAVAEIVASGRRVALLSGDERKAVKRTAELLGISDVNAEVMSQDKAEVVQGYRKNGRRVMMVGDGVNDAPAIASADVGVAMAGGTDVAIESADIVVIGNDPRNIARFFALSRRTLKIIRQNLLWAFLYNILLIPIAAGALILPLGISLSPEYAAIAMSISSITVVGNSLRLRR